MSYISYLFVLVKLSIVKTLKSNLLTPSTQLFQSEVDALSKRAKAAETAFLSIYKKIIELPDPLPALEQAETLQKKVQKLGEIEIENQKLKGTLRF